MDKLVFIVEDNIIQQKFLEKHFQLNLKNYKVKTFDNPEDMMSHLNENPYAIVLDHFYDDNEKNGLDYLQAIRKKSKSIPVIYHTSSEDDALRKKVLALGAEDYIIKNSASLVYFRNALDKLDEKKKNKSFFQKIFNR